jgi:hypothetical protein
MLREGAPIGVIVVSRAEPGPYSDSEIELMKTFADQAVIAIENVRLFTELKESLEQQTATSEILRAISQSPTDVQPVLKAVVGAARQLQWEVVRSGPHDPQAFVQGLVWYDPKTYTGPKATDWSQLNAWTQQTAASLADLWNGLKAYGLLDSGSVAPVAANAATVQCCAPVRFQV